MDFYFLKVFIPQKCIFAQILYHDFINDGLRKGKFSAQ